MFNMIKTLWQKYKQFVLFCIVGASNTVVSLVVSFVLLKVFKSLDLSLVVAGASVAAGLSSVIGDIAGAINSYILNSKFVFDNRNKKTGGKFIVAFIIYTVLSAIFVMLLNRIGVPEEYCKFIVTPVMLVESYLINKFWVFKK